MSEVIVVGGGMRLTPKTSFAADLQRSQTRLDNPEVGVPINNELDRHDDRRGVELRWSATRRATVVLRADTTQARFDVAPVRDSNFVRLRPSVEWKPRPRLAARTSFGYMSLQPLNNDFPKFAGAVGSASFTFPLTITTQVAVDTGRDMDYSYQHTNPMYVVTVLRGSMVQRFGSRWELEFGAGRHRLAYRSPAGPIPSEAGASPRVDRGLVYRNDLRYRVTKNVRAGFNATYFHRYSHIELLQSQGFRAGASLQFGFDR
jgi:hypothetical protein